MSNFENALALAAMGFWVFRLKENGKTPAHVGWQAEATRDPKKIALLFGRGHGPDYNVGIFTSKFRDNKALVAIDEDNKNGKNGHQTLFQLDFSGSEIPLTCVQTTPTGGRHHIYVCDRPVKQGANVLGDGLDIRSRGGYLVGAGSTIDGVAYTISDSPVVVAPAWLVKKLSDARVVDKKAVDVSKIDTSRARGRAEVYLANAPIAEEGSRNDTAFKVACELKDRGVTEDVCLELVCEWNENNEPPLEIEELEITVNSAYKTGQNAAGIKAAETVFSPVVVEEKKEAKFWFDEMNESYALVLAGGSHHVLWETKDEKGRYKLEHLNELSFHRMSAHKTVEVNGKQQPQTKVWIADKQARRYDGLTFAPERPVPPNFFNMWRGFSVKPMAEGEVPTPQAQKALDDWLAHGLNNVCNGNPALFHYLLCHFAHLIQKPWEKPLVALVFKGEKGVGKNALLMFVNHLLGHHALTTAKKRYLTGNFNGHFESCLAFTLDEAIWGGDKDAEGALKDLITGLEHWIEQKGKEGYSVPNLTRVYIIGNEDWLAPASHDERRYCVLNVNNNRKQDTKFFENMKDGMFAGGDRLLLSFLKSYDMKGTNVNVAPQTEGLLQQKIASLDLIGQWWYDCLLNGEIIGSAIENTNFTEMNCGRFRNAFHEYLKRRNVHGRFPSDEAIGRAVKLFAPSVDKKLKAGEGNEYRSLGLEALRQDFAKYLKGTITWPDVTPATSTPEQKPSPKSTALKSPDPFL